MSRALAAHVAAPLSFAIELRGSAAQVRWIFFCSGWLLGCLELKMDTSSFEWNERPQAFSLYSNRSNPGRNTLRYALVPLCTTILLPVCAIQYVLCLRAVHEKFLGSMGRDCWKIHMRGIRRGKVVNICAVSYTHLTLPTKA